MSSLVDQMDESELLPPEVGQVNKWHTNYIMAMGALPEECEEPSAAQLAVLNKRVQSGQPPYVDFAVWLPFGRRSEKSHKFRVYVPLGNGEIQVREQPGPSNFQAWTASWRVFKAAAIMLDIISMACLSRYEKAIERLVLQWPACWGLVGAAEDKARSERWMRLHRKTIADRDAGKPVPRDWTIDKPWSALMVELAMDLEFWTEHVHIPATAWMANGQRGAPRVAAEDAILHHLPLGTVDGVAGDKDDPGGPHRKRQANRDRRLAKRNRLLEEREELARLRKGAHSSQVNPGKGGGEKARPRTRRASHFATRGLGSSGLALQFLLVGSAFARSREPISAGNVCLQLIKMLIARQGVDNKRKMFEAGRRGLKRISFLRCSV